MSEEVEALAREIAGPSTNAETQEIARQVAEAQIDLCRVRRARHQFLSDSLSKEYYDSYANTRMKAKVLRAFLRPNPPALSMKILKFATSTPQGPEKFATIVSGEAKKLLAMDRYERRALSRRKFAIRAFDAARRSLRDCNSHATIGCILLILAERSQKNDRYQGGGGQNNRCRQAIAVAKDDTPRPSGYS